MSACPHEYLLHGSCVDVSVALTPHASPVVGGEKVVFATSERWLALISIPRTTNEDFEYGFVNGVPYVREARPGASKLLNVSGFIHTVDGSLFASDQRVGMRAHEFVRRDVVPILTTEFVTNVADELRALGIEVQPR